MTADPSVEQSRQLQAAIDALEAQRSLLGDAVVDAALGPIRERLALLLNPVSGAPMEQVRKQVSVLFLDVVGSTALSQHMEPEDIHAVIDGVLQRCTHLVSAHGGKVLQYAGDNLLAAFGAEQSREDDAERAVHCGLALLDEGRALAHQVLGEHGHDGCHVRVGINTGTVLLGGGVDKEGTIRGATVNLAARMEQTAPPGTLRVSHDTWLLVRDAFDAAVQKPLQVKGFAEPLQTYLVQRALPDARRAEARNLQRSATPMVGRSTELQRLLALPRHATQRNRLQGLTLIGEPGIGKSRLLHELQSALQAAPQSAWLLIAKAQQPSQLQPYALLHNLLVWRLQIADSDSLELARQRLVEGLIPWLGEGGEAKAALIGQLIGMDFSASPALHAVEPSALRQRAFAALHDWLRNLSAEGRPPLLLLEDLQWADDGSLDFIEALLQDPTAAPLVVVATARSELLERRPGWVPDTDHHQTLYLQALDTEQADALTAALLQRVRGDITALQHHLVQLADGNPYFIEELVRMCRDQGVIVVDAAQPDHWRLLPERLADTRMPTTLVGVLQARLDALPTSERRALQQASIVGHVFWDEALAALDATGLAALPALRGRLLVQQHEGSSFDDSREEAFRHHLLQQVTYDTVLRSARRAGHAAAADWLAERMGDRPAEFLAVTAQHYERAGLNVKAAAFYERAALEAGRRFANAAALAHAERALHCTEATSLARRYELHGIAVRAADIAGQRPAQQVHVEARNDLAGQLGDEALLAQATMDRAVLASRRGDEGQALMLAGRAAELAERSGAVVAGAMAQMQLAWSHYSRGEVDTALAHALRAVAASRQALAHADSLEARTLQVRALTMQGIAHTATGAYRDGQQAYAEALRGAIADGLRLPEANLRLSLGTAETTVGHHEAALLHYEACSRLADEIASPSLSAVALWNTANVLAEMGRAAEAEPVVRQALVRATASEAGETTGRCHVLLGQLHDEAGDTATARAAYRAAASAFEDAGLSLYACHPCAALADMDMASGDLNGARAWAERVDGHLKDAASAPGTSKPAWPLLICHRVWSRCGDDRAGTALFDAYREVQALAECAGDEDLRRGVLTGTKAHREVMAAWAAAQPH